MAAVEGAVRCGPPKLTRDGAAHRGAVQPSAAGRSGDPVMKVLSKIVVVALACAFLAGGLCGCEKKPQTPGEKLDHALEKASDALHDAGDALDTK